MRNLIFAGSVALGLSLQLDAAGNKGSDEGLIPVVGLQWWGSVK